MKGKNWARLIALLWCLSATAPLACTQSTDQPSADGSNKTGTQSRIGVIQGRTMGTTYQVKLRAEESFDLAPLKKEIQDRLQEINSAMSTYDPDSEISKLNRHQSSEPFPVSADFFKVLSKAQEIHASTDGRFDVTVGPLVRLWGFGGGETPKTVPAKSRIDQVLKRVGAGKIRLESGSVVKQVPVLEIDLSAIAKGYAVDELGKLVGQYSQDLMVEVGGEVFATGRNPDSGNPWAIGVEVPASSPLDMRRKMASRIELNGQAVATSGDYRNLVTIDGKKYQHTIDPKSGYPVDSGIHSVSVVADDCMTADALATGLMVCQLEKIQQLSQTLNAGVLVIYDQGDGVLGHWQNNQFTGQVLTEAFDQSQSTEGDSGEAPSAKGDKANPIYLVIGTIVVFGLAIAGMAIGVIMSNRQLKGSCGGLSAMAGKEEVGASPCSLCTKPATECSKRSAVETSEESAAE